MCRLRPAQQPADDLAQEHRPVASANRVTTASVSSRFAAGPRRLEESGRACAPTPRAARASAESRGSGDGSGEQQPQREHQEISKHPLVGVPLGRIQGQLQDVGQGYRTRHPNRYLDAIDLNNFEKRSLARAAIVVPVHLPFGQIGMAAFGEPADIFRVTCLVFIIAGMVGLNLASHP